MRRLVALLHVHGCRMPDATYARFLARALPAWIARDAFEPAWCDLHADHVRRRLEGRHASEFRHVLRVLLLYLDCWRLAITGFHRRPAPARVTAPRPTQESSAVILYHLRHAFRRLVREPGFTAAAVLTLALGLGANLAVFAVVEAVLLRPLPYTKAEQLVILNHRDQRTGITKEFIAMGDYVDLAARQSTFSAFGSWNSGQATIFEEGEPWRISGLWLTSGSWDAMAVVPEMGRGLRAEDTREGAAPVMLLSHDTWQRRFGGDPAIVGRTIQVNQTRREVIGITPAGFSFPPGSVTEAVLAQSMPTTAPSGRKNGWTFAVGRLVPGATVEGATNALGTISKQLEAEYPQSNAASRYFAVPLRDAFVGNTRTALLLLLGAVAVVLLIACTNVSNLILARALARRREMAVRLALGARRGRLMLQLLAESVVLSSVASVVGIAVAVFGARALVTLMPGADTIPGLSDVRLNGVVLLFGVGLTIVAALVFSLVASLTVRAEGGASELLTAGRASMSALARRATSSLVVAEIAFALVLLVGAGLILRSFAALVGVNPGFRPDHVLTMDVAFPPERYKEEGAREALYARVFSSLQGVPGVEKVGVAAVTPLTGNNWTVGLERVERPVPAGERPPEVGWQAASGGYFQALQIPLISGRLFDRQVDRPGSPPVVIISDALAKQHFAGESAIGRRVRTGDSTTAEIVGVVGSIRRAALNEEPRADMYFPFERNPAGQITFFIRTARDPEASSAALQRTIKDVEPRTVFLQVRTLSSVAAESVRVTRLVLLLLMVFAAAALGLAAVGIFAVMSYVVRQRSREIGTRMALGASHREILLMVMRQGSVIAGIGTVIGLGGGLLASRALKSLLYGVTGSDPIVLVAATAVLATSAMLACYLPARRAAAVDPARTLVEQ